MSDSTKYIDLSTTNSETTNNFKVQASNEISIDDSQQTKDDWAPQNPMQASNEGPRIGRKSEVQPEEIFNEHLQSGYRMNYTSWRHILNSLFEWHNETLNIWTHLVGFCIFFVLLLVLGLSNMGEDVLRPVNAVKGMNSFLSQPSSWDFGLIESQRNEFNLVLSTIEQSLLSKQIREGTYTARFSAGFAHAEDVSKWPIVAFLFTALFCLGSSTACHWFYAKEKRLCRMLTTLDYWGITTLILGTSYPFISYRYACGYLVVYRYIFVVILTLITVACMVVTMYPAFLRVGPKAILFISFGFFCFVPTIVLYLLDDPEYGLHPGLAPFTWSSMSYLIGLTFFATKFPERMSKTGRFDLIFQSHQIHHVCVLIGVTLSFLEGFDVYQDRLAFVCPDQKAA